MRYLVLLSFCVVSISTAAWAQEPAAGAAADVSPMLSEQWGKAACSEWNKDDVLSKGLKDSGWISNSKKNRGFRIIEIYRSDCANSPHIQLKFQEKEGKAFCVDSGPMFDKEWDFLMYAETKHWVSMGKGEVGPMGGMMTGKLNFKGSMWEAMQNMGPFKNFLLLFGKVPSVTDKCN
ncbi:MAG: SCP2 sterol-binding domain-containing protein [Nitrospinota bacterium]|nr:SCP2 sterol-binding domain-containing protein [Nitrospinota bacterium]